VRLVRLDLSWLREGSRGVGVHRWTGHDAGPWEPTTTTATAAAASAYRGVCVDVREGGRTACVAGVGMGV
jgi:hypothetical protein